jgi:hypothetical protein
VVAYLAEIAALDPRAAEFAGAFIIPIGAIIVGPRRSAWSYRLAFAATGAFHEMIDLGFGNVVCIKAGLSHRTIL